MEQKRIKANHVVHAAKSEEIDLELTLTNKFLIISPLSDIKENSVIEIDRKVFLDPFEGLKTYDAQHYVLDHFDKETAERMLRCMTDEQKRTDLQTTKEALDFITKLIPAVITSKI